MFCRHHWWQPYAWMVSFISFIGVLAGLYQDAYKPVFQSISGAGNEAKALEFEAISIPITIQSSWENYTDLERKAEYFIYRHSSPGMKDLIESGSARVLTPEGAVRVNGKISIAPYSNLRTNIKLPKSQRLHELLESGGYELELVIFNSHGTKFRHAKQQIFDEETLEQGFSYWFHLVN